MLELITLRRYVLCADTELEAEADSSLETEQRPDSKNAACEEAAKKHEAMLA